MSGDSRGRGPARTDGRRYAWTAIAAVVIVVVAMFTPAIASLPLSGLAVVLGFRARREARLDPTLVAGWLWIGVVIVGGFVFVSQLIIVVLALSTGAG